MSNVILAMSIGVNIPKWQGRAEAVKEDYGNGQLGGVEIYVPPRGAPNFNFEDIHTLGQMLSAEINDAQRPLYVGAHLAHRAHGFNPLDGMTQQNINCIDTAIDGVKEMSARHLVVHAGGRYPGQEMSMDNVRAVFDYLSAKLKDCTVVIENMYKALGDDMEPFYCTANGDGIDKIGREYEFGSLFDWTHLAIYLYNALGGKKGKFEERYCDEAMAFLRQKPRVFHISTFRPCYRGDRYGFFTEWNRSQIRAAALYTEFVSDEPLPIVLEVKYNRWARMVDKKNLDIAGEEITKYWGECITKTAAEEKIKETLMSAGKPKEMP